MTDEHPWATSLHIGERSISPADPTYFVADIASNHDGDLERAKQLIRLCAEAGADAAKFQHFKAETIVSDAGFRELGGQLSHQADWEGSVFETYARYALPRDWTEELAATARDAGIHYMSTPYDRAAVERLIGLVPAFKVGSGDITWTQMIEWVGAAQLPVLLASGAAEMSEVETAVQALLAVNPEVVLMQCNTNYTGDPENFRYVNLRVLETFAKRWPGMILGLSDHTPGHAAVLGAVALGARVVEKHFTDDNDRSGPDHRFSLNPMSWREMVDRTRELELAFGDGVKRVEPNESETVVVQRRSLRFTRDLPAGSVLGAEDLEALRPAPAGCVVPSALDSVIGRRLVVERHTGDGLTWEDLG